MNKIEASYEGLLGPLPHVVIPTSLTIDTAYGTTDEYSIYQWDERDGMNIKKERIPLQEGMWKTSGP